MSTIYLSGPGLFEIEVVGESHYQDNLGKICGRRSEDGEDREIEAVLVLEDGNRHDKNAVRVEIKGLTVGYLARDVAKEYRRQLRQGGKPRATVRCRANIRGGWRDRSGDQGHYGVWLDLPVDE